MNQRSTIDYPSQFAILLLLLGLFLVLTAFLVPFMGSIILHVPFLQVLPAMNMPENANVSRLLNTVASMLAFLLPALILARVLSKQPFTQLGFSTAISNKQLLLIVIITLASMILSGALGELNEKIPIPAKWFAKAKALEDTYKAAMLPMAYMKTTGDYILALLVLAAAPAIFEEVLFRGGFQQIFIGWTKSKWTGILITGILFSAIHFSYFGFLPRLALGIVLGLIFFYSKNIWLNIALHFLNNAFVVTQLYIVSRQGKSIEKTLDESMPIWWGALAVVFLIIFFRHFKKESDRVHLAIESKIVSTPETILF
jgi:uncharacterized protein